MAPKRTASKSPLGARPKRASAGTSRPLPGGNDEEMKESEVQISVTDPATKPTKIDRAAEKQKRLAQVYELSKQMDLLLAGASKSIAQEAVKMLSHRHGLNCVPLRSAAIVIGNQGQVPSNKDPKAQTKKSANKEKTPPPRPAAWKEDPDYRKAVANREAVVVSLKAATTEADRAQFSGMLPALNKAVSNARDLARQRLQGSQ